MICSLSNWKVEYSINETILSGEHSLKFKVPIGMTMYAPIAEFTYIYNDVTYTATVRYNGSF